MPAPSAAAADIFALQGEVALVTGAARGLGRRFAEVLAANGARVAVTGRDMPAVEAAAEVVAAAGGQAMAVRLDVTDGAGIAAAFAAVEAAWGPVGVVVNNAGVASGGRAVEIGEAQWRACLDVDLDGVLRVSQEAARRLIAADRPGTIVNIASILGIGTQKGVLPYTVAKAAVVQLTKALAAELAPAGIRVNAIAPGYFVTDLNRGFLESASGQSLRRRIPLRRFGAEGELDGTLLLLASRAGAFMTGSVIVADGGQLLGG